MRPSEDVSATTTLEVIRANLGLEIAKPQIKADVMTSFESKRADADSDLSLTPLQLYEHYQAEAMLMGI